MYQILAIVLSIWLVVVVVQNNNNPSNVLYSARNCCFQTLNKSEATDSKTLTTIAIAVLTIESYMR